MDMCDEERDTIFVLISHEAQYAHIVESMEELPLPSEISDTIDYHYGSLFGHRVILAKATASESKLYALPINSGKPIPFKYVSYTKHISEN